MPHMPLRELQRWMQSHIRPSAGGPIEGTVVRLNPQRGTPGEARLAVYADGYMARIRQALAEAYEAVHQVLGETAFTKLAHSYARAVPSSERDLGAVGRHLPAFLTDWPLTQQLPFLPDLARLEWSVREAFHAFEEPPLDAAALAQFPLEAWERTQLVFQPSVKVIISRWPIRDLWAARTQPRESIDIDLVNRPQRVLVCRRGLTVICELIEVTPAMLLDGLLAGRSLGAVCEEHSREPRGAALDPQTVTAWFAQWVRAGLIIRCEELTV